jgi:hypothetical protein
MPPAGDPTSTATTPTETDPTNPASTGTCATDPVDPMTCPRCGIVFERPHRPGRKRDYCTQTCRLASSNARRRDRRAASRTPELDPDPDPEFRAPDHSGPPAPTRGRRPTRADELARTVDGLADAQRATSAPGHSCTASPASDRRPAAGP